MTEKNVKFTKHALQRARERKLWKFVSKAKVFYDATYLDTEKVILDNCIYVLFNENNITKIVTMYSAN